MPPPLAGAIPSPATLVSLWGGASQSQWKKSVCSDNVSRVMVLYSPDIVRETWFKRGRGASTWAPFCRWVGLGNTGFRVAFFYWV